MLKNSYNNFVKASTSSETSLPQSTLSGAQAQKIYLEEVRNAKNPANSPTLKLLPTRKHRQLDDFSNKDLFLCVQNNDVEVLRKILDSCPSLVDAVDEFGWSLLMIACQADSVDAARELLKRGVDTSVRDKGGNSATNLVLKNKNLDLADLLISHTSKMPKSSIDENAPRITKSKNVKTKIKEHFKCESCDKDFPDKEEHLASTIHNINASKGKKIPPNYKIPQNNRGYQIMLKVGWDRDFGLGKDGSGNKYPIKAVQKIDKKGLGHDKKKDKQSNKVIVLSKNSKSDFRESRRNERRMEMSFRREFY